MDWKRVSDREVLADEGSFLLAVAYDDGTSSVGEATALPDGTMCWAGGPSVEIGANDEAYWQSMPEAPIHSAARRV